MAAALLKPPSAFDINGLAVNSVRDIRTTCARVRDDLFDFRDIPRAILHGQGGNRMVCAWLGNAQAVAAKHYLQGAAQHFELGATRQIPTQTGAQPSGTDRKPLTAQEDRGQESPKNFRPLLVGSKSFMPNNLDEVPPLGLEPRTL